MFLRASAGVPMLLMAFFVAQFVPAQDSPASVTRGTKQFDKRVVISGLAGPWEITWGPDSMLWVTERTGKRISRVNPVTGEQMVAITIAEVSAPGGQDGLLGLALHPKLLKGENFIYAAYTYVDKAKGAVPSVTDPESRYRYLYSKIVRFAYNATDGKLSNPVDVITGLPSGNDHNAGRLKIGPDEKLYFTIGDRGHNQLGNFCQPIESQRLATKNEVNGRKYAAYVGKSLRINLDGSVPKDNPTIAGVVSHIFTYGHRNPQGIDFGPDGTLYSSEQGPKTDDEINILKPGSNYGWPNVAGMKDNKSYQYARWAESKTPCSKLKFSDLEIEATVPRNAESEFKQPIFEPIATMFTVPTGFNFHDPACKGVDYICWPTVGASSIEHYQSGSNGIPGWDRVLFVTTLKRGSLYVLPLTANGQAAAGKMSRYFQSENRYRDTALNPDGKTIYIATDFSGLAESRGGGVTTKMENPGAILAFTYTGEGAGSETNKPALTSQSASPHNEQPSAAPGMAPQFTARQALVGKTAYESNCAVCHGNTMTNGTFGTPLAGEYFKGAWSGKTVRAFYDRAQQTMPPAAPSSLSKDNYANIVAYILEVNGYKATGTALGADDPSLDKMTIK